MLSPRSRWRLRHYRQRLLRHRIQALFFVLFAVVVIVIVVFVANQWSAAVAPIMGIVGSETMTTKGRTAASTMANPAAAPPLRLSISDKRDAIRRAVLHAWGGYEQYAFGHDEVLPLSRSFSDGWGHLAWTLVDSIGTLHLVGAIDQFALARDYIAVMRFDTIDADVSTFETTIRILGGLLAAYEFSGDFMFINQAKIIGDALMPAFGTPSGLASAKINLRTGQRGASWTGADNVILSEFASIQMEFAKLSYATGDPKYVKSALKGWDLLRTKTQGGLQPTLFSRTTGRPTNHHLTMGAMSDSYYEYLLKLFIVSDGTVPESLQMYIAAMDDMIDKLVVRWRDPITNQTRARLVEVDADKVTDQMQHLACFVPGMLALGAQYGDRKQVHDLLERKEEHMELAVQLLDTCIEMYNMTRTGLAPEFVVFRDNRIRVGNDPRYLLRPETVESLFVLYRITNDERYREEGWRIFEAIEKHCRTAAVYAAIGDVDNPAAPQLDNMESFILAETFKYLYLLFSPSTLFPLDRFVLTTEAHPFRIMKGSDIRFQ